MTSMGDPEADDDDAEGDHDANDEGDDADGDPAEDDGGDDADGGDGGDDADDDDGAERHSDAPKDAPEHRVTLKGLPPASEGHDASSRGEGHEACRPRWETPQEQSRRELQAGSPEPVIAGLHQNSRALRALGEHRAAQQLDRRARYLLKMSSSATSALRHTLHASMVAMQRTDEADRQRAHICARGKRFVPLAGCLQGRLNVPFRFPAEEAAGSLAVKAQQSGFGLGGVPRCYLDAGVAPQVGQRLGYLSNCAMIVVAGAEIPARGEIRATLAQHCFGEREIAGE